MMVGMIFPFSHFMQAASMSWVTWLLIIVVIVLVLILLWWFLRPKKQAPPPEPVLAQPPLQPSAPVTPDDLKLIEGIGPKIAETLASAGITTFKKLAEMEPATISEMLANAGIRLADPTSWPEQARLGAENKMEELKTLQDSLKGGRKV